MTPVEFLDDAPPPADAVPDAPARPGRRRWWLTAVAAVLFAVGLVVVVGRQSRHVEPVASSTSAPTVPDRPRLPDKMECWVTSACDISFAAPAGLSAAFAEDLPGLRGLTVFTAVSQTAWRAPFLYAREIVARLSRGTVLVQLRGAADRGWIPSLPHRDSQVSIRLHRSDPSYLVVVQWVGPVTVPVPQAALYRLLYDARLEVGPTA